MLMLGLIAVLPMRGTAQPASIVNDDTSAVLSLSLDETLARAQKESFPVRSADADRRAATARKRQSLGVFLPRITAREQGLYTTDPVNAFGSKLRQERFAQQDLQLGALNTPDRVDFYGTQVEVEQPILNLDGIVERRAASDAARAAGHKAERTKAVVAFRVKKGYYGLLLAERQVGVIDSALAAARANRDQAQALFDEGIINQADRLAAEVRVSELESQRSEAVAQRDNAADRLRFLIGLDENVRIEPTDSLTRESTLVGDVSLEAVNQRRSDMRALRARADAAQEKTRARWLAFVPTLNARGTAGWYDDAPFGTSGQSWTAGVSLSWSLFEGFQQIGRAQEAEARQHRAEIALEQQALENDVEITSARRDLRAARERIEQARTAVAQAEESLRIRTNRYGEGMARTTDLLQAEATLAERRLASLRALYQHNVTVYRLELLTEQSMTQ
ncbi:TolC family protein [Salinibacter altiplanensis]|uniref:TolC family protein n=1 Tax=Salinibacter altiplanensis TaxID=1803181 RepID=UPI001E4F1579|nr:TolC family protein [Salinibacter altiplanensis]